MVSKLIRGCIYAASAVVGLTLLPDIASDGFERIWVERKLIFCLAVGVESSVILAIVCFKKNPTTTATYVNSTLTPPTRAVQHLPERVTTVGGEPG